MNKEEHVKKIDMDEDGDPKVDGLIKEEAPPGKTPGGSAVHPAASPTSSASSPVHEFSFTHSLHQSEAANAPEKTRHPFAVDLTPADDIFFHGQLLPLQHHHRHNHHLSAVSPRTSSISSGIPISPPVIREYQYPPPDQNASRSQSQTDRHRRQNSEDLRREEKSKPRSFSSMFWPPKWKKGYEVREKEKQGKKVKFDVTQVVKRYMKLVTPLLGMRGGRRRSRTAAEEERQSNYSYSGHISVRGKWKKETSIRGRSSAPASLRASPANSGVLLPPATSGISSSSSVSTMEDLQSAIQAAIAHCKNSSATSD
ncbi:unnamed protein product [Cuscuta epithymum]|uniref:BRI1 kinase inhibitor 1 n=1 Tax=Cuscuta epithymum TaxID=186058 RepID=A0AAV0EQ05_9ASTE|nr:unnamed protein product [Cuscuta epithymum]